jgi:hypothetical protein
MKMLFVVMLAAMIAVSPYVSAAPTPVAQANPLQLGTDAFMGDYAGNLSAGDGKTTTLCAQVIALGGGAYQANLIPAFMQPWPPLAVLQGKLEGDTVNFEGTMSGAAVSASIKDRKMNGKTSGGGFFMQYVVRESPTLGMKAPEGAIVLFDGSNCDSWLHPAANPFIYNLAAALGTGDDRVGYLKTWIYAPRATPILLVTGSDDGLKIFLNGTAVFGANEGRAAEPGSDKTPAQLNEGWNQLLLKVTQGNGDWEAVAQVTQPDGGKITGLTHSPAQDAASAVPLESSEGYITEWQVSGPYVESGKNMEQLFDTQFPPETGAGEWKPMPKPDFCPQPCKWRLLDNGAMEVGGGGIMTRQRFAAHKIHIEFRLPFMPEARGQARANSGVFAQGRYEVQVLDSYGLEGKDNECGGIYKNAAPKLNMCFPPLQWQTYDITFVPAQFDAQARMTRKAVITVLHNGVPIHQDLETGTTPGGVDYKLLEPGPLYIQDHGNPVWYRNIWVQDIK